MAANHKAIVDSVNAAFARNDIEGFLVHCADDVVFTMVGHETLRGKDAVRKSMGSMNQDPPVFTVQNVIAEGDAATAHGEMMMKEKDGTIAPYAYCDIYRFRGDRIAELKAFVMKTGAEAAGA